MDMDAHSVAETSSLSEEDPFIITDEQRDYYLSNFKHLQKATQGGQTDLEGAIEGKHPVVRNFFRKSEMSNEELGKVWHLADVNQDGFLNAEEFCTAMHLIVMRVKGDIEVPDELPDHLKPRFTPPRNLESAAGIRRGLHPTGSASENNETPVPKSGATGAAAAEWTKFERPHDKGKEAKKSGPPTVSTVIFNN